MSVSLSDASRRSLSAGSRSFALAALLFDAKTREGARLFYAWCRYCDDVIDGQNAGHGQTRRDRSPDERFRQIETATQATLAGQSPEGAPFEALARAISHHGLPRNIPLDIIEGFRMDVAGQTYRTVDELLAYCYHVAGAVGVGMARIMGVEMGDSITLDRACDLGIAFQLTNIARDVIDDACAGRVYLPATLLGDAGCGAAFILEPTNRPIVITATHTLLDIADHYYNSATTGAAGLGWRNAWATLSALNIYREIGRHVRSAARPWERRQTVSLMRKLMSVTSALARLPAPSRHEPTRAGLWTRGSPGHCLVITSPRPMT